MVGLRCYLSDRKRNPFFFLFFFLFIVGSVREVSRGGISGGIWEEGFFFFVVGLRCYPSDRKRKISPLLFIFLSLSSFYFFFVFIVGSVREVSRGVYWDLLGGW